MSEKVQDFRQENSQLLYEKWTVAKFEPRDLSEAYFIKKRTSFIKHLTYFGINSNRWMKLGTLVFQRS